MADFLKQKQNSACAICICDVAADISVAVICVNCGCALHVDCLVAWLLRPQSGGSCPLCSTPMSNLNHTGSALPFSGDIASSELNSAAFSLVSSPNSIGSEISIRRFFELRRHVPILRSPPISSGRERVDVGTIAIVPAPSDLNNRQDQTGQCYTVVPTIIFDTIVIFLGGMVVTVSIVVMDQTSALQNAFIIGIPAAVGPSQSISFADSSIQISVKLIILMVFSSILAASVLCILRSTTVTASSN